MPFIRVHSCIYDITANQIKGSWNAASFSKCDSANATMRLLLLLAPAPAALLSTVLQLLCPLGRDHVGLQRLSRPTELSRPVPSPPNVRANSGTVVFHSATAAHTAKHVWVCCKGQIHQMSPLWDRCPRFWHVCGRKMLKRNVAKQIHVNNVFPYLTLALDFWEKAQEGFFQAQTRSMHFLPLFAWTWFQGPDPPLYMQLWQ